LPQPQNEETEMPARSVLYMHPRPGRRDDLVATFDRLGVVETAMRLEQCLSVELQVPTADEDGPVLVTALWSDPSGYDAWLAAPERDNGRDELYALLEEPPVGTLYEIRVAGGATASVGRPDA
jgi:quinol monooxygenase YgiN